MSLWCAIFHSGYRWSWQDPNNPSRETHGCTKCGLTSNAPMVIMSGHIAKHGKVGASAIGRNTAEILGSDNENRGR